MMTQKDYVETTYGIIDNPQNKKLIATIKNKGSKVFVFPKAEAYKNSPNNELEIINQLDKFDWIIFTDIFAVDFFIESLEENNIDVFEMDNLRVCAFGEAVSDRLRFSQIHADVIPNNLETPTIFQAIKDYLFDEKELEKLKVLIIKEKKKEIEIAKLFVEKKAVVTEISVYESQIISKENLLKLKTLLQGGAIDEFVFYSVEDIQNLLHIVYPQKLTSFFSDIKALAADATSFQTLREHNLTPSLVKFDFKSE